VVEIVVLGSGTGIPHPRRGAPGLAVLGGRELIAVDLGPGALRALARAGLDYRDLRRVLFTHYHPDHVADLVALLFASRHRREGELQLLGPPGLAEVIRGVQGVFGRWVEPGDYELTVRELNGEETSQGPWTIAAARTPHTEHSVAYRLHCDGRAVVVTGDTAWDPVLIELAGGADLLIAECSYPDELAVEGHLSPSLVGRIAREAGVAEVLLVHMYPETDSFDLGQECAREYLGKVTVGHDLLRLRIGT
jgi:ribonuclease BN (tRNA processing enzyme)